MKKAKLSTKQIKHINQLAGLNLTPAEMKKFQDQLSRVLNYVGILESLKTEAVEPISQVTDLENVFRQDEIDPSLSQQESLSGAAKTKDAFFVTKSIFER